MTFYEWVLTRKITDNHSGDFLFEVQHDKDGSKVANTKQAWEAHIGGNAAVRAAFAQTWAEYERSPLFGVDLSGEKGYVYFIRFSSRTYKIGMTRQNPHKRLAEIQTGCPVQLVIYGYIETDKPEEIEAELHKRFNDRRISGEWFRITDAEIDDYLSKL